MRFTDCLESFLVRVTDHIGAWVIHNARVFLNGYVHTTATGFS